MYRNRVRAGETWYLMDRLWAPLSLFPEPPDTLISLLFSRQSHCLGEERDQVMPSPACMLNGNQLTH